MKEICVRKQLGVDQFEKKENNCLIVDLYINHIEWVARPGEMLTWVFKISISMFTSA